MFRFIQEDLDHGKTQVRYARLAALIPHHWDDFVGKYGLKVVEAKEEEESDDEKENLIISPTEEVDDELPECGDTPEATAAAPVQLANEDDVAEINKFRHTLRQLRPMELQSLTRDLSPQDAQSVCRSSWGPGVLGKKKSISPPSSEGTKYPAAEALRRKVAQVGHTMHQKFHAEAHKMLRDQYSKEVPMVASFDQLYQLNNTLVNTFPPESVTNLALHLPTLITPKT